MFSNCDQQLNSATSDFTLVHASATDPTKLSCNWLQRVIAHPQIAAIGFCRCSNWLQRVIDA